MSSKAPAGRKPATVVTTDAEIDAAIARGKNFEPSHRVVGATYSVGADEVRLRFENGTGLEIPRKLLQGLEDAKPAQLRTIQILGPGTTVYWPDVNVGHHVPELIGGVFGTRKWMSELGRLGAGVRTPAKSAASRENGKKGGRPRGSIKKTLLKA